MQNVERLSITLPTEMARLIRAKVDEGGYASNSEVIREAMRAWQTEVQLRTDRLADIRAQIAKTLADPSPMISDEELEKHFKERFEQAMNARGDNA
jgi:antitoxin ParD1/3/4